MSKQKNTPVQRIKRGAIEAAIWKNDGKTGPFHSVTFKRSYKTAEGDYRDSHAYTLRDLFDLVRCVIEAQMWMATTVAPAADAADPATRKKAS